MILNAGVESMMRERLVGLVTDVDEAVARARGQLARYPNLDWTIEDIVCPICESYTVIAIGTRNGENGVVTIGCQECKSKSSDRDFHATRVETIARLRHVPAGPGRSVREGNGERE